MRLLRRRAEADRDPVAATSAARLTPTSTEPLIDAFRAILFGAPYSPALVEKVGVATRCLQLVAQQIATMSLRYRRRTPEPAGQSYEPAWVSSPDPAWYPNGIGDALFASSWSMYAAGDAFLWCTSRYESGYPATFTVLDPATMIVSSEGGRRAYESNHVELDPSDVLQITRDPRGGLRGTGALEAYASNLIATSSAEGLAGDVFAGGGIPNAILKSSRRLTAEQAADVQAQWLERVGSRFGAPAVIPPDLDFEQLAFSPKDLLLLESRIYDGTQLCGAFGVPPPLVGLPIPAGGLTYTTTTDLFEIWWRSELMPAAKRIESSLSQWLPRGSWVEFDPTAMLRPNLQGLTTSYLQLLEAEVVTADEVRAAVLDLPPLSQGEALELIDEPAGSGSSELVPAPTLEVVGNG